MFNHDRSNQSFRPPWREHPLFHPIDNLLALRQKTGLTQQQFWRNVGLAQSSGSRYEHSRPCPVQVTALLRLLYLDDQIPSPLSGYRVGSRLSTTLFAPTPDPRWLRDLLFMNQHEFWGAVGVSQSNGSCFERGRKPSKAINALLRLVYLTGTLPLNPLLPDRQEADHV